MARPSVVFVVGRPGSGKGTQCEKLAKEFGYFHLNVGGLLRTEKENPDNPHREVIAKYMNGGNIVPSEITCSLLEYKMGEIAENYKEKKIVFLLDGFPRNLKNLKTWDKFQAEKFDLKFVFYLNCPENICAQRILERSKTSGRSDDNLESLLKKRFPQYETESLPVLEHYKTLGIVKEVNTEKSSEEVYADVREFFLQLKRDSN